MQAREIAVIGLSNAYAAFIKFHKKYIIGYLRTLNKNHEIQKYKFYSRYERQTNETMRQRKNKAFEIMFILFIFSFCHMHAYKSDYNVKCWYQNHDDKLRQDRE